MLLEHHINTHHWNVIISRTHGGHSNLFGSSIQHNDTIHMVLREGKVTRGLMMIGMLEKMRFWK